MSQPPYLQVTTRGVVLKLKIQARAGKNEIGGALGDELKMKIKSPPVDDAANQELVRFLAEILNLPRNSIEIISGRKSNHKSLAISGLGLEKVARALGAAQNS